MSAQEQALDLARSGRLADAIALLREAAARAPDDAETGLALGSALHAAGDHGGSAAALRAVLKHHPDHGRTLLYLARAEARLGDVGAALATLARAEAAEPQDPQVWQVAAGLAAGVRDWPELLRIARGWTAAHPASCEAWQALSRAHFEESRFIEAVDAFAPVLALEPGKVGHLVNAGRLALAAQLHEAARDHLAAAEALAPESGEVLYALSRMHHLAGDLAASEACCLRAIATMPDHAPAYAELGALREGRLDDADVAAIERLLGDPGLHSEYRAMLGFTLGDALDRRGESARAFAAWEEANRINRTISEAEGIVYDPKEHEAEGELLATLFASPPEIAPEAMTVRPIFVVGMPRSGTTLVESILAAHSAVHGAGELPTLPKLHKELMAVARQQGIAAARELIAARAAEWRARYLAALPAPDGATSVVDKQPINYRSVGLIRVLFPDSPVLHIRRSPMETGFSIYRHNFSKNWPCAHRLEDIGRYYGIHARICAFWQRCFPDSFHAVDYAALVRDQEGETRRLLALAGLDFEPACFAPHETTRPIATFSGVQVRRPVSSAYSGRAAARERWLGPLRAALEEAGLDPDSGDFTEKRGRAK